MPTEQMAKILDSVQELRLLWAASDRGPETVLAWLAVEAGVDYLASLVLLDLTGAALGAAAQIVTAEIERIATCYGCWWEPGGAFATQWAVVLREFHELLELLDEAAAP